MRIAHARINEMGTIAGGSAGDQTGKEVCVQDFVENGWDFVFRANDQVLAERIAAYAEQICQNDCIGYDQPDRYSMCLAAKANGWRFDKIQNKVNTDCSQMVASILQACGMSVSTYMYTGNERGQVMNTGKFSEFTYTRKEELRRGDILLTTRKGHTAVCLDDGTAKVIGFSQIPKYVIEVYGISSIPVRKQPTAGSGAISSWPSLGLGNLVDVCDESGGWYYIRIAGKCFGWIPKEYTLRKSPKKAGKVTTALHLRQNAGAFYKSITVMPEKAEVQICDEKPAANGTVWYYVIYNGQYGFASSKYIL